MTTEARSLEQCVADARAILDGAASGPWEATGDDLDKRLKIVQTSSLYPLAWVDNDDVAPDEGWSNADLITLSRNTYSSLLDLVEAAEDVYERAQDMSQCYVCGRGYSEELERIDHERICWIPPFRATLRAVHESLQENLP